MARIYKHPSPSPAENKMAHPVVETKTSGPSKATTPKETTAGAAPSPTEGKQGKKTTSKKKAEGGA